MAAGKDARLDKTFNDEVVIAGFVEQHVHPVLAALNFILFLLAYSSFNSMQLRLYPASTEKPSANV